MFDGYEFRRWLEGHPTGEVVGVSSVATACPLASFLSERIGEHVVVGPSTLLVGHSRYNLPWWAYRFVELVDHLDECAVDVTAGEALAILRQVEAEFDLSEEPSPASW